MCYVVAAVSFVLGMITMLILGLYFDRANDKKYGEGNW